MIKRAISVVVLAAVVSVSAFTQALAEEVPPDRPTGVFGIGAGLGARFGLNGIGVELSPVEHIAFTAGVGSTGFVSGYAFGVQLFPAGRSWKVRPWLSVCAGELLGGDEWWLEENASFVAYAVGGELGIGSRHTIEFGIDYIAAGGAGEAFLPTVGYKFHF